MKTRIFSTGCTGWQFLPPEWPVAKMFSAKLLFLPETLEGKKPEHLCGVEKDRPHSSHRQMPSPCTAVSWEECLEQQDMHGHEYCTPTGPKYLKLCCYPHSYCASANALNLLPACWWKLFSSQLKYFQIHFPTVCSRHFLPGNGVIFSLLWWQWEPGGEGQTQSQGCASHPPNAISPSILLQWCSGELREGQQPKNCTN